jgi:hypothetical protein
MRDERVECSLPAARSCGQEYFGAHAKYSLTWWRGQVKALGAPKCTAVCSTSSGRIYGAVWIRPVGNEESSGNGIHQSKRSSAASSLTGPDEASRRWRCSYQLIYQGQREPEGRALARRAAHPDLALVPLDDGLADVQS